ncbi:MAG: hypothetical protein ABIQ74_02470 [Chitinophagales bacterium]
MIALLQIYSRGFTQVNDSAISQVIYLTGNTAESKINDNLSLLRESIKKESSPVILIYNGDLLHDDGLNKQPTPADSNLIRELLGVVKDIPDSRVYFTPGDLDWNESGKNGWRDVKKMEDLIDGISGEKIFLPRGGCPGPVTVDAGNNLKLVMINSQWWIHPHDRPIAPATECEALVEEQFMEELENVLDDASDKNVLVLGHHPAISIGKYGGRVGLLQHFSPPVLGTFNAAFHQNVGSPKDIAYPAYGEFSDQMKNLMQDYSIIYASSHDYNLQAFHIGNSYQLVSGSIAKNLPAGKTKNTIFRSGKNGFIKLSYYNDGKVMMDAYELDEGKILRITSKELFQSFCDNDKSSAPLNTSFIPCREENIDSSETMSPGTTHAATAIAGPEYKAGILKKIFLGTLYRSSWTVPVNTPYLNLDSAHGGLIPTGRGGGRQTHSLSFDGADGKAYVFRSIDKDPIKALDPALRKTLVLGLARQITATQNPYGALPVSSLLANTSIFHVQPQLFLMPDDISLGAFKNEFSGMLGMLEEKPKKGKGELPATFGADNIVRSNDLFKKLYKSHDHSVDAPSFAFARIFDIWIGDWGRHEDNWKWAGFKQNDKTVYYPIPRDRDHAFSHWNGILPYLASRHWALPNAEDFGYHFHDLSSLTWPSRHLDRFLLTSLDKDDWLLLTTKLQALMPDVVIDSAIAQFPAPVIPLSGKTIEAKLKSRRNELKDGIMEYYSLIAKHVDVVGSNKAEYFNIARMENGEVEVSMFDKDKTTNGLSGDTLYHRIFKPGDTRDINIYGLDGEDVIIFTGARTKKIMVRVFGGRGRDIIDASAVASSSRRFNRIYHYKKEKDDSIVSSKEVMLVSTDDRNRVEYNRQAFQYDVSLPLPILGYSPEEGFVAGFGFSHTFHYFGEDGYGDRLSIGGTLSTQQFFRFKISNELHHAINKWDWIITTELSEPHTFRYFYGLGNETIKNDSLPRSFYLTTFNGFSVSSGLQRILWRKSKFSTMLFYEKYDEPVTLNNILSDQNSLFGTQPLNFTGVIATLDIDFRDNPYAPKSGVRLFAREVYCYITNVEEDYTNSEISLEFYQSTRTLIPITLGIKGGATHSTGEVPFYKLNTLGRTSHLRGYLEDRFTGNSSVYLQNQLTLEFGSFQTFVAPITIGIFGFYDVGRVWIPGEVSNRLHSGYGGGFYFTPLFEILTTRFSLAFSEEEKKGLFEFGLGLRL